MYRDSVLGPCLDITGPDGNIYEVWATGNNLARQLGKAKEWEETVQAAQALDVDYLSHLVIFKEFFPIVTLVGFEEIKEAYQHGQEKQEGNKVT